MTPHGGIYRSKQSRNRNFFGTSRKRRRDLVPVTGSLPPPHLGLRLPHVLKPTSRMAPTCNDVHTKANAPQNASRKRASKVIALGWCEVGDAEAFQGPAGPLQWHVRPCTVTLMVMALVGCVAFGGDFGRRTCAGPKQSHGIRVPSTYQGHRRQMGTHGSRDGASNAHGPMSFVDFHHIKHETVDIYRCVWSKSNLLAVAGSEEPARRTRGRVLFIRCCDAGDQAIYDVPFTVCSGP